MTRCRRRKTALARCERVHIYAAHACGSHAADCTHKHAARELEVDPRHSTAAQSTATAHAIPRAGGTAAGAIIDIVSAAAAEACLANRATAKPCCVDALYQTVVGFRWSGVGAARRGRARVQGQRAGSLEAFFSSRRVVSRAFIWVSRSAQS